jgi:beta-galactosidase
MDLANDESEPRELTVRNTIYSPDGEAVQESTISGIVLEGSAHRNLTQDLLVQKPVLWQLHDGKQYLLRSEILDEDTVIDTKDTRFGYRWIRFDPDTGFSINGESVKLQGVCLHHDQGSLGAAACAGAIDRQLDLLEEMGVNAIRCAHNPADHHFLEECSRRGLLVVEEAFDTWSNAKNHNDSDYSSMFNETIDAENKILEGQKGERWC